VKRRRALATGAALAAAGIAASTPVARAAREADEAAAAGERVLRYAFPVAESSFDPAAINDVYSRTIITHVFESLYCYDHLARPARIVPLAARGEPEVSDDFRVWTVRVQPGIFFTEDPAFGGRPRELVAQDFVTAFQRCADPATKSPLWQNVDSLGFTGLAAQRREAIEQKKPFDYARTVPGLRALDRYTVQFRCDEPRPRLLQWLAIPGQFGGFALEVAQHYGARIGEHPVGTGPFVLAQWRRSSLIVLERNRAYRERRWDCRPAPDDAPGQAIARRLRGRRVPLLDRVEVSIIEEAQPRWLSFLNGQTDLVQVPPEFIAQAMPAGRVAPNLARAGVQGERVLQPDVVMTLFNMTDPVVGGYTPERVALRRAIGLAVDLEREIQVARRGMAIPAQSPVLPHMSGYDPAWRSENSAHSPARARALLDLYGWTDRDGDGWREQPDGSPLVLQMATQPDQSSRQLNELMQKNLAAVGLRVAFRAAKWPENLRAARAGQLQMWGVASSATSGDGQGMLMRYHSKQAGMLNLSRFALPEFDAVYDRLTVLPDGPERDALFDRAKRIAVAWAPYKLHAHRFVADLWQPWVVGYRRPPFWNDWWHMVDVQPRREAARA
jgi:ABC-type transport system substrate-binding protein